MRAARIYSYNLIDRIIPNGLSLYILGAGLLAAGLAQFAATTDAYYGYRLETGLALLALMAANGALAAVVAVNALRRFGSSTSRARLTRRSPCRFS